MPKLRRAFSLLVYSWHFFTASLSGSESERSMGTLWMNREPRACAARRLDRIGRSAPMRNLTFSHPLALAPSASPVARAAKSSLFRLTGFSSINLFRFFLFGSLKALRCRRVGQISRLFSPSNAQVNLLKRIRDDNFLLKQIKSFNT